ncbi:MAG TPA: dienelactone hydrolase family protein [Candidatus Binataceae bacterium]|nr:dienelactone hydrolase family protein [Candidatus Binataceae bacterium]
MKAIDVRPAAVAEIVYDETSGTRASLSRREFVVATLATGFALSVLPVSAQTITTDSNGLVAGEVRIPVSGGEIPGYRAMPASGGPFPTILVVHEIFGVHEHIKDICRRLAKAGYFAVAPYLYARQGEVASKTNVQDVLTVVRKVPEGEVASDLDATVAWAKSTGSADTSRLGITGFCWGGRQVWLYAVHNPDLKAGVAWYGPLQLPKSDNSPVNPTDEAAKMNAPVLGLYGGADQNITPAQVEAMRAAIKAAGKSSEIIVYPDAPHGFNADYRPSYRAKEAADGWARMLAWFKKNGVG